MRRAPLLLLSLVLMVVPRLVLAQTNSDVSSPATATAPAAPPPGPVVEPPQDQAPPPPAAAPTAPANPTSGSSMLPPPAAGTSTSPQEEILDIRPPVFFARSWIWLWLALASIGLLALLGAAWFWFRPRTMSSPKTAYDLALENLERARPLMQQPDPAPYAVAVSEAIRLYLSQRFMVASTRSTTEEFLRRMQADSGTPVAEHRDLLGAFLQSCDLVKFARYQPTEAELEKVQQSAFSFVTATKPVPVIGQKGHLP